jgi:hypothetical protein
MLAVEYRFEILIATHITTALRLTDLHHLILLLLTQIDAIPDICLLSRYLCCL